MKKLFLLWFVTSVVFSEPINPSVSIVNEKLEPELPKRPDFICYQQQRRQITYLYKNNFMVAEVLIEDQVFLGWRPPCYPYCGIRSIEFAIAAEALEEQVKTRFPDAKACTGLPENREKAYSPMFRK